MNSPSLPIISPTAKPILSSMSSPMSSSMSSVLPMQESSNFFTSTTFKVLMLVIILAILGVNLFQYLANTTDLVTKYVSRPVLDFLHSVGFVTGKTVKTVVTTTDKGIKSASTLATGLVVNAIDLGNNSLKQSVNTKKTYHQPEPDDARNTTQLSKPNQKSGFCYIGEDRGFRSCIEVTESDSCESGDIYPSRTICINPTLRP
mgnify:CR=1 FL=1